MPQTLEPILKQTSQTGAKEVLHGFFPVFFSRIEYPFWGFFSGDSVLFGVYKEVPPILGFFSREWSTLFGGSLSGILFYLAYIIGKYPLFLEMPA